jgi:hypothetical protein
MWSSNTLPEANSGHSGDKRIGGTFGTYGRDNRYIQDFGSETWGKATGLNNLGMEK